MERYGNQAASPITLAADVNAAVLSWTVNSLGTGAFVIPSDGTFSAMCDNEIVKVTAVTGPVGGIYTLTVARAQEGTSAASHSAGVRVYHWLTKRAMEELVQVYRQVFTTGSPPTITVLGTDHDFDFSVDPPVVQIWDDASPVRSLITNATSIGYSPATGNITITFPGPEAGTIVVLGRP